MSQSSLRVLWLVLVAIIPGCTTERDTPLPDQASTAPSVVTLSSTADYAFQAPDTIDAGWTTFRFANNGNDIHLKLAPGATLEDIRNWLNPERARRPDQRGDEPPPSLETLGIPVGGMAAMAPGKQGFFEADLTPGDYVLVCMVTAPDGRSHIEHGMMHRQRSSGSSRSGCSLVPSKKEPGSLHQRGSSHSST